MIDLLIEPSNPEEDVHNVRDLTVNPKKASVALVVMCIMDPIMICRGKLAIPYSPLSSPTTTSKLCRLSCFGATCSAPAVSASRNLRQSSATHQPEIRPQGCVLAVQSSATVSIRLPRHGCHPVVSWQENDKTRRQVLSFSFFLF